MKTNKKTQTRIRKASTRSAIIHYDQALPEIPDRQPHLIPTSHLIADGKGSYQIIPHRRESKLLPESVRKC